MDIGAGKGSTAAALAVNFGVVLATEIYWMLAGATTGRGFLTDRSKLFREDGSSFNNIVSIHIDASHPHSFGIFAVQNISACVIDAQHDFAHIGRETFAVLRQIPCCVETIVYHDYCDVDVFNAVQYFVSAGILAFRTSIGMRNWVAPWCRDGRPEGAAMRVLRHTDKFHERLETLY
ncbi:PBPe domain-containing protein, partial [Durusdinium trenchii]